MTANFQIEDPVARRVPGAAFAVLMTFGVPTGFSPQHGSNVIQGSRGPRTLTDSDCREILIPVLERSGVVAFGNMML